MLVSYFILALSVSIDSLGIGITYGLRNTKISIPSNIILFVMSVLITSLSVYIGNIITHIFSESFASYITLKELIVKKLYF